MSRHTDETKTGGGFKPEMTAHRAICCQIIDLGTHDTEWDGKVTGKAPEINYTFEFVDIELEHDGEKYHPMWGIREQKRLGPKNNMKKYLEGWRGRQFTTEERENFDWGAPLGKPCLLVIGPNTKGNPKLMAISATKDKLEGTRDLREFWIEEEEINNPFPEWMPEWIRKIIEDSYEYSGKPEEEPGNPVDEVSTSDDEYEDDVPF